MNKYCTKCNLLLTFDSFTKTKVTKDGYYSSCKKCRKSWRDNNKVKINNKNKLYCDLNRKKIRVRNRQNYNKEKYQIFALKNKEQIRINHQKYYQKNYNTNVKFKLPIILRTRLNQALKNNSKIGSAVEDLGCSINELKLYLESKFQEGMTWKNHGLYGWHIDHIIPLYQFDLTNKEEFLKACHYSNLQPLWAKDNLKKGAQ